MEWISVRDRLPIEDQKVICIGYSGIFIGEYNHRDGYWAADKYIHCEFTENFKLVTHWMPLPQPPEE
jgi:hypothetical protein